MKNEILTHRNDPRELERIYRRNKDLFKREFNSLYPQLQRTPLGDFWSERLNYESEEITWGSRRELIFVVIASLIAGFIAKLPSFFNINEEFFYSRNIGFIVFPALSAYFGWKNKLSARKTALAAAAMLAGLLFINFFPDVKKSDTLTLSCIHLILFLWSVLGFVFIADRIHDSRKRLDYLKYNGDLVVMSTLILIAGGIMSAITIGLFSLIGFHIERFYTENVVVFGVAAAPLVGTYLTQTNPHLVGKVSPVIARIFSPLVLVMLVVYLAAMMYSGKNPYSDRDFLIIFNALLVGVMAIIFFSVAEASAKEKSRVERWILFLLSVVTIIVNGIALSAILFRISEWGITPNRAAVLGGNVLILLHLLVVSVRLFHTLSKKADTLPVGHSIAFFLPAYCAWTIVVTFVFPLIFGFR